MKPAFPSSRFFAETVAIIASVEAAIMFLLPVIAPEWMVVGGAAEALLDAALLTFVAWPLLLWRIHAAVKRMGEGHAQGCGDAYTPLAKQTRLTVATALAVLVVGLFCSVLTAQWLHQGADASDKARFERLADRVKTELEHRLATYTYGLRGLRGFYAGSKSIKRGEFREYVNTLNLNNDLHGALGIGFIQRVPRDELEAFVAAARADEAPDFKVRTSGDLPELYVTKFIEPLEANQIVLGWDIATDPTRRAAVDRAMLTGEPSLSGRVTRTGDAENRLGFRLYLAVYRNGTNPVTPEERRRDLVGWVYAPLVIEEALADVADAAEGRLDLEIFDGPEMTIASLLYDSDSCLSRAAPDAPAGKGEVHHLRGARRFQEQTAVTMGGREWTMWHGTTPAFNADSNYTKPVFAGAGGAVVSLLLAIVVWSLGWGLARALALAAEKTLLSRNLRISEAKAQTTLATLTAYRDALDQQTTIAITDVSGTITEVNEPFCRISGYRREELIGVNPRVLNSGHHPKAFWEEMWKTITRGDIWRAEVCNKAKDGTLFWLDTAIGPMRDAAGRISGYIAVRSDVTERKHAEEALRESERFNRQLVESSNDCTKTLDLEGRLLFMSKAGQKLLGIDDVTPLLNTSWPDFFEGTDKEAAVKAVASARRAEIAHFQGFCPTRTGEPKWWDIVLTPVRQDQGPVEKILAISRDISQLKRAEADLQKAHRSLETKVRERTVELTEANVRLRHEVAERQLVEEQIARESERRAALNRLLEISMRTTCEEELLRNALDTLLSRRFLSVENKGAIFLVGDKPGELTLKVERNLSLPQRTLCAKVPFGRCLCGRAAESGKIEFASCVDERHENRYDGMKPHGHYTVPIRNGGQTVGVIVLYLPEGSESREGETTFLGAAADILGGALRRLAAENQLRHKNTLMAEALEREQSITEKLEQAKQKAETASRAKSDFLACMSHELRTPLNGMIGMTESLLGTNLDAPQRRYAWLAKSSGDALLSLINDILDFSKIEAGKLELESTAFDLPYAVEGIAMALASSAERKRLELTACVHPEVPSLVRGDPGRLQQVLMNLIGNAIKFTKQGEVTVRATLDEETEERIIVRFSVNDTGIGIPADRLDRLFQSFSQVDASTTRKYGGTGLGLAICKRLVELMGGRIGVISEEGKGSTFWFTAPLEKQHLETRDWKLETRKNTQATNLCYGAAVPLAKDMRILLAEDHEISQEVAAAILARAGYPCDTVADGKAAVEAVVNNPYDLVLMDCQMPEMDGFEATRAIRQAEKEGRTPRGRNGRIPIIAMTANAIQGDRERCLAAGMDDYLSKPFNAERLIALIESQFSRKGDDVMQVHDSESDVSGGSIPPQAGSAPPLAGETQPMAAVPHPFDLDALLKKWGNDRPFVVKLVRKFQAQVPKELERIERSVAAANAVELGRVAHGLKGSAAYLAAHCVREVAARLEEMARSGDWDGTGPLVEQLRQELEKCLAYEPEPQPGSPTGSLCTVK